MAIDSDEIATTDVKPKKKNSHVGTIKKGQKLEGSGRPKGSKQIYGKDSVERLQELWFDPIERMVIQYHKIDDMISEMNLGKRRYSAVAMQGLLSTQASIINNLMKYGYRSVPERREVETSTVEPLRIILSAD